jgi:thiol-disulfide isomerase/thioredoxin
MKRATTLMLIILFTISFGFSQEKPATADEIMEKAIKVAKKENKAVFLMFHASWCGWCKKMDAAMNDDSCKEYFNNSFVTIHMVVKESKDNKHLENPGADELLAKYKGDRSGIPFWLIFDNKGSLIADSFMRAEGVSADEPGSNIGCPAQENEVAAFIKKLKLASSMTEDEEVKITERFKKNNIRTR